MGRSLAAYGMVYREEKDGFEDMHAQEAPISLSYQYFEPAKRVGRKKASSLALLWSGQLCELYDPKTLLAHSQ